MSMEDCVKATNQKLSLLNSRTRITDWYHGTGNFVVRAADNNRLKVADEMSLALRDVLRYLVSCGEVDATAGETFDIGGPDVLTYRQMMMKVAQLLGKRVRIYGIPILSPRLSSYWVDLVTDVPSNVARPLIDGLRNEVICRDDRIKALIPIDLTPFPKAVELAINGTV